MAFSLRLASIADAQILLPRSRALQEHEGIEISDAKLLAALRVMLEQPDLGCVFVIEMDSRDVGYAFLSYSFDLEFGGREAWLTEIYIDDSVRGYGAGTFAIQAIEQELKARGVLAVHLQVRADNPALRLYQRMGFHEVPRLIMSKRL
ncbi:MAG: GNAT family N-acetyltransferase [Kofleriaceae bacterium]